MYKNIQPFGFNIYGQTIGEVYPFFINRGQSNYKYEKRSVDFFNNYFGQRYPNLYHNFLEIRANTPGDSYKNMLRKTKKLKDNPQMRHDIAYPSRNPIIFLTGMEYAYSLTGKGIDIKTVFASYLSSDDLFHSSLTCVRATNLLMCQIMGDYKWQLISIPIEREFDNCYDKDVYIRYCAEHNIPIENTRSCVKKTKTQCGKCPSCWERRRAFKDAGVKDKTKYLYPMPKALIYD